MTAAKHIVKAFKHNGIDTVFGVPGRCIMPLYDALMANGINHVLCHHEQGSVVAAGSYARASGRVGVCIASSGPEGNNLVTGIASAHRDAIPLLIITGREPFEPNGNETACCADLMGLSLAMVKQSYLVTGVTELARVLEDAIKVALSGRPGPVWVDIPKDLLAPGARDADTPQTVAGHSGPTGGAVNDDAPYASITGRGFIRELSRLTPEDTVFSCEANPRQGWAADLGGDTQSVIRFGLPAAVGAQFARPDQLIVNVTDDGAFMINAQELATIQRYRLPIKLIVLDSQNPDAVRKSRTPFLDNRERKVDLDDNPDFVALARAFGIPALTIERVDQVRRSIGTLLAYNKAILLHVVIAREERVWPIIKPGQIDKDVPYRLVRCKEPLS